LHTTAKRPAEGHSKIRFKRVCGTRNSASWAVYSKHAGEIFHITGHMRGLHGVFLSNARSVCVFFTRHLWFKTCFSC